MPPVRPYYADLSAVYYDQVTALDTSLSGDVEIYASLAQPGSHLLEVGAGTGRLTLALAERGFFVTGVDIAPTMLERARAKLESVDADVAKRVAFVRGDMTALAVEGRFSAALFPFFTLAHVPRGAAWRNVFGRLAPRLEDGALAAFHMPRVEALRAPPPPPGQAVMTVSLDAGRRLELYIRERRGRDDIGRYDQVVEYVVVGPAGRRERSSLERLTFFAGDPTPFAEAAGFVRDREPIPLGDPGEIHVFRKS
jgi:SAM-dependent methyltransferase